MSSKQITIVGGHGQIARTLSRKLVERGHGVRGVIRSKNQVADLRADGAEAVLCDIEQADAAEFDDALSGSDVVVFAAGAGPNSGAERKKSLDRDGAIASVEAAVRVGASRFVIISSMGAGNPPAPTMPTMPTTSSTSTYGPSTMPMWPCARQPMGRTSPSRSSVPAR